MLSHFHITLEFYRQKGVCTASDKILLCVIVRVGLLSSSVWMFDASYGAILFCNLKVKPFPVHGTPLEDFVLENVPSLVAPASFLAGEAKKRSSISNNTSFQAA